MLQDIEVNSVIQIPATQRRILKEHATSSAFWFVEKCRCTTCLGRRFWSLKEGLLMLREGGSCFSVNRLMLYNDLDDRRK